MNTLSNEITGFYTFGLSEDVLKGVNEAGFVNPSPVQVKAIPAVLEGRDVLAQAHTGTGKTAAFGLPIMSKMKEGEQMLVLCPTRELAMQVSDELFRLGKFAGIRTAAIYGGQSYTRQYTFLSGGTQVVVATPGRLLDLLSSKNTGFKPKYVVLDEADEMLDMGFIEDINQILEYLPKERQTLLFSATISKMIEKLANSYLKNPLQINTKDTQRSTNDDIEEQHYVIEEHERDNSLVRLIDFHDPVKAIVFTRTKKDADRMGTLLVARGYPARALHGDLTQPQREEVIKSFRKGEVSMLVATDVAARGLDIADVSHVFNYHLPFDPESYVHRIGRTGRAGNKGIAITLVTPAEYRGLTRIQKATGGEIEYRKVPSLSEAHKNLVSDLASRIKGITPSRMFEKILGELEDEMEHKDIILRMASIILSHEGFSGPEHIGVTGKRLEKLQSNGGEHGEGGKGRGRRSGSVHPARRHKSQDGNKGNSYGNRKKKQYK